ncbi:MAG TPA: 50S ribosomal protein L22 [Terriglobales bacterium]|nr:50S ribosomal protein L22 [Terriglobales bacterium]
MAEEKKKETRKKNKEAAQAAPEPVEEAGSASATAKYVRVSARKMRLVADQVRGKRLAEARSILAFSPRAAARVVDKAIASAAANAETNHDLSSDELFIRNIYVNEGPTLRRFQPRAMGRANRIRKRTSHLTVELAERKEG